MRCTTWTVDFDSASSNLALCGAECCAVQVSLAATGWWHTLHVYTDVYIYTCVNININLNINISLKLDIHTYIYRHCTKTCAYMDVYAYLYTCIYTERDIKIQLSYENGYSPLWQLGDHSWNTEGACRWKNGSGLERGSKEGPSLKSEIDVFDFFKINMVHHPIYGHLISTRKSHD